ncbi:hypothetical protein HXA35_11045 [Bacillus sp. A301a_S52]|nr:hypothetical protein [Bacillus sp. A301a_S52]
MIPIRHKTQQYVKGNTAIIGDAASNYTSNGWRRHEYGDTGWAILGELLTWMYKERN